MRTFGCDERVRRAAATHLYRLFSIRLLYDSDYSIGDEDEQDDNRFDERRPLVSLVQER